MRPNNLGWIQSIILAGALLPPLLIRGFGIRQRQAGVIAHSGLSGSCSGIFAASTKRRTSSTEARLAFAVLTRERNAA